MSVAELTNQNERLKEAIRRLQLVTDQEISTLKEKIMTFESQDMVDHSKIIALEKENLKLQEQIIDLKEVILILSICAITFYFNQLSLIQTLESVDSSQLESMIESLSIQNDSYKLKIAEMEIALKDLEISQELDNEMEAVLKSEIKSLRYSLIVLYTDQSIS
jgi:hypothetical protein